jgi:hypothetical protein
MHRTEQTYCQRILRYIHHFGGSTHPRHLGAKDVEEFLSHLATEGLPLLGFDRPPKTGAKIR